MTILTAEPTKPTIMNKLKLFLALIAPICFMLNSCQPAPAAMQEKSVNVDSVKALIVALENGYAAGSNAKNVDAVAVYYAEDAQSMANDEPTRVGMAAIKAGIAKDMAGDTTGTTISFETTGVWAAGNYATETGTSTVKDKAGKVVNTGKYITLFELRNGKYVAIRDMWNRDAAKPAK